MMESYIKKVGVLISIVCGVQTIFYGEVAGAFCQPQVYCRNTNGNIAILLPYKEGKCTAKSKEQLKKLAHFAQALNAGLVPPTASFKMFITSLMHKTSGVADPRSFSSQVMLLLGTGKHSEFIFALEPSVAELGLSKPTLIATNLVALSKFPIVLYVVDEIFFNDLQQVLSSILEYQPCALVTSVSPATELVYSLLRSLEHPKKLDIVKTCFSKTCDKPSTIPCEKCSQFWYCSGDCNGYKEHVKVCEGLVLNDDLYREFKSTSHIMIMSESGLTELGSGTIEDDLKGFKIKKANLSIQKHGALGKAHLVSIPQGECTVCKENTHRRCKGCYTAFYCSVTCQKSDWKKHKNACSKRSKKKYYLCNVCKSTTKAVLYCQECAVMFYCSRACQERDLK